MSASYTAVTLRNLCADLRGIANAVDPADPSMRRRLLAEESADYWRGSRDGLRAAVLVVERFYRSPTHPKPYLQRIRQKTSR